MLEQVVRFYSLLQKIYQACDAVSGETFRAITPAGKMAVLDNLEGHTNDAIRVGNDALASFRHVYGRAVLGQEAFRPPRDPDHASREFLQIVHQPRNKIAIRS